MPAPQEVAAEAQRDGPLMPALRGGNPLLTLTLALVCVAAAWWLLKELAVVLRPLLVAVFLGYILLPLSYRLRPRLPGPAVYLFLIGVAVLVLLLLILLIYASSVEFGKELPSLLARGKAMAESARAFVTDRFPRLADAATQAAHAGEYGVGALGAAAGQVLQVTTEILVEFVEVIFYLIFLMLEVGRLPQRIQSAFSADRARHIESVVNRINEAMSSYLALKVRTSLYLALPVALVLGLFGVKLVLLWAFFFFLSNFVTYFGSILACGLVILFTFFQLDFGWQPIVCSLLVVAVRVVTIDLIEPRVTGKVVDLSPLLILVALAFWGLVWGWVGMLLAVPLTVMIKIVMENTRDTQPLARLMAED